MGFFFTGWIALMLAAMPVAFTLAVASVVWLLVNGMSLSSVVQRLVAGVDSFVLLAVPFFILAGLLMNHSGVSDRIFRLAHSLFGHFNGGMGHVNVMGSLVFSGMSGSAVADAGGLGVLEIKAMREHGYPAAFAGALTCASCIIGPLVPPSIPMVIYGMVASTSVGALFLGGVVPGFATAFVLMVYVYFWAKRHQVRRDPKASWRHRGAALQGALLPLLAPVIILGGIFGGVFTPPEAAGVAALYALMLGTFVYRTIGWKQLPGIFREAVLISAVIGMIVACSSLFSWVIARERVPQMLTEWLLSMTSEAWVFLTLVNILLLVLGCFLDSIPILLLVVPILMPSVSHFGIDSVHFGVVVVMNLMIGLLTPPFGVALFTVAKVGQIPLGALVREVLPMLIPLLLVLVVITYVPASFMWLPRLFYG